MSEIPDSTKDQCTGQPGHPVQSEFFETPSGRPTLQQVRYFHIDDMPAVHADIQNRISNAWGTPKENRVGTARTTESAIAALKQCVDERRPLPHVILLDQKFYISGMDDDSDLNDKVPNRVASEVFVEEFESLIKQDQYAALSSVYIISVSDTDDDKHVKKLKSMCSNVIGRAPKQDQTEDRLVLELAGNGVVEWDETATSAKRSILAERFRREASALINGNLEPEELRKNLLQAVNIARNPVTTTVLHNQSVVLESILQALEAGQQIEPELLFEEDRTPRSPRAVIG